MTKEDCVKEVWSMYKANDKFAKYFLIIFFASLLEIVALSIWLGFPSPYFNRVAIAIVGYVAGVFLAVSSMICYMITLNVQVDNLSQVIKEVL
jgi:hypothetical protein